MKSKSSVIVGCGDVGRRLVKHLLANGHKSDAILSVVRKSASVKDCQQLGIQVQQCDLDQMLPAMSLSCTNIYYLVPPNQECDEGKRADNFINTLKQVEQQPNKVVLVSTTGVYGDCAGEWVTEQTPANPQTARGKRRLQLEQQWQAYSASYHVPLVILRVPGIYANSRIPYQRLKAGTPVVDPAECGFSNRIHADDLAMMMYQTMAKAADGSIYNATDGTPGKISEYLQQAAIVAGVAELPIISLQQAQTELSKGMLSYLGESRKISNQKILDELQIELKYPDYKVGLTA